MREILLKLLIFCYGGTIIIDVIAYWPTIKDLYNKKPSANIASYVLWSAANGIAFAYSVFILPDLLFRIVSGTFLFSNLLILFLSIRLKNKH